MLDSKSQFTLATQLTNSERHLRVSIANLKVFVGSLQFGIHETARLGVAVNSRLKDTTSPPRDYHEQIAQRMIDTLQSQGQQLSPAWSEVAGDQHRNMSMLFNMAFVNALAVFDAFITDVFCAVLVVREEMLRLNKKSISYRHLLTFSSMKEMKRYMAFKEINELSYSTVRAQWEEYTRRFNIKLNDAGVDISQLEDIMAQRNLLAHNNGVAN